MSTISQQQGKVTPRRCIPPKKQKRAAPPVAPNSGTTGREIFQIWDYFSKFIAKGGKCRAKCNYCTKTFAADSVNGTTTLWNHLTVKCLKSPFKSDKWQTTLKPIKRGWPEGGSTEKGVFNMDEIKRAITEFIIIDEQPFRVVEGEGFKKLMAKAFPNFEVPSRVTVARHCLRIYQEEKEKLKELIKNQRVCLTNHKGETIAKGIENRLLGWGIENLFTATLDNATANDAAIKILKGRIEDWKGVMFENQFLHGRCNAHILNLIVKEGLDEQIEPISHRRSAIKYVRSSSSRFATFKSVVEKVKIDTRGFVSLDVETRWNSTYTMLDKALKFENVFARMYVDDQNYQKQCREIGTTTKNPSTDDWKNVKAFVKFLNIFYQATLKFSGSLYSTSDSFFHDFFNLQNDIIKYTKHDDLILVDMATRMKSKMDKYWGKFESMNMLLSGCCCVGS
ncbi:zinc finger BED domain-containing protein RICESLEEPER 2-like [Solanum verrucosum]|uniref:zinc finger BED domain-containing protein RICESLEEPER 2-like n=1 Tax=Solanum verrucosum TaxID=315347 RepID=UPI0020D07F33|nr:zinc finger BED domain-containing protein RICESLEEPER 2-like [Solanum verrucosum]